MSDMMQYILLMLGAVLISGMVLFAFAGPSADKASARRLKDLTLRHSDSASTAMEAQLRKAIASRKPRQAREGEKLSRGDVLANRITMTGKSWTVSQYVYASLAIALLVALMLFIKTSSPLLSLAVGGMAGLGIPHIAINMLMGKRKGKFTTNFPDAIELMVRGLRSGLPVTETLGIIGREVRGPVGEEFKSITERIRIGRTMDEALVESAKKLDMAEFNFFCITLAIQRETGGNLAETLGNLSDVLRKRAQMKLKIKAMSAESKYSAYIVGSLPFMVALMIMYVNPEYLAGFATDDRLIITGLGGAVWMSLGAFVMYKMVNFEI